jgi:flagella basal body P-ring formation protein FlgA
MRGVCVCLALIAAAPCSAQQWPAAESTRIEAESLQSLQGGLLEFTQRLLEPSGLIVDRQAARLLVDEQSVHGAFQVRPLWSGAIAAPLIFELIPLDSGRPEKPIRATLAIRLQKQVWVAARRLRKGSSVTCGDLVRRARDIRELPVSSMSAVCELDASTMALRDLAPGDVIRSSDLGQLPDVISGTPVRVRVAAGSISVMTMGTALADAKVGDRIDVRLEHPLRTLRTRVVGPAAVQLVDEPT